MLLTTDSSPELDADLELEGGRVGFDFYKIALEFWPALPCKIAGTKQL